MDNENLRGSQPDERENKKKRRQQLKEKKKQERADKAFIRWFAFLRFVAKLLKVFLPYERHNEVEHLDENRPYVFLCNHYSMIDVMYPAIAVKKPLHFMAKKDLWDNAFFRWFCNKCRCIPVSRDGASGDVKAVMQAMKYLKNGENILIYPEGTRNKGQADMLPFKGGFAAIAIKTRTAIVPIVQSGKPRLFRKSHVFYGKPIEFTEYYGKRLTEEDIAECENKLREIMLDMRADYFKKVEEEKRKKSEKRGK